MRCFIIIIFILTLSSCNSQNKEEIKLNHGNYEVLTVFLNTQRIDTYLDKHFFKKNLIQLFYGKYQHHKKIFKNSDSICKFSRDTVQLKMSCQIAEAFKKYDNLLSQNDLDFLLKKYENKRKENIVLLEIDTIISNTSLREHSKEYYNKIKYDEYGGIPDIGEYPSVQIENVYFNQFKNVAIVAYSVITSSKVIETNFFLLEKTIDLKWEPIGSLKL